uniref:Uncharacterized protein n=1 Tax=Marseillevirus LCMAC103 TaxID=2506604 RepID=A0A481YUI2_9VIRU|nr:MAG: hypothetical protein LCMAC103_00090 [Marseillevirus LCMAC103]
MAFHKMPTNNVLTINGVTSIPGATATAGGAISAARVLTAADSGSTFLLTQGGASFRIDLPAPAGGMFFKFVLETEGSASINIQTLNTGSEFYIGSYDNAGTATAAVSSAVQVQFKNAALTGDTVELSAASSTKWFFTGRCVATGGVITDVSA